MINAPYSKSPLARKYQGLDIPMIALRGNWYCKDSLHDTRIATAWIPILLHGSMSQVLCMCFMSAHDRLPELLIAARRYCRGTVGTTNAMILCS